MGWLEFGLIGSIVFALYYVQQIKLTLKSKGYDVALFSGWMEDYRKYKRMILDEADQKERLKYQANLNGLYLSVIGFIVILYIILQRR